MVIEQRAWIGPKVIIMKTFQAGQNVEVLLAITNSGKTPALNAEVLTGFTKSATPLTEIPEPLPDNPPTPAVYFPDQQYGVPAYSTAPLSQADFDAIKANTLLLYLVAHIRYTDIFRESHNTKLCAVYDPVRNGFSAHGLGNTAD